MRLQAKGWDGKGGIDSKEQELEELKEDGYLCGCVVDWQVQFYCIHLATNSYSLKSGHKTRKTGCSQNEKLFILAVRKVLNSLKGRPDTTLAKLCGN